MASLNKVFIIGRLTQDPACKNLPSGSKIITLTLALNHMFRDEQGNKQNATCYIDVVCLGKIGELAAQYLSKGRECHVEGRLRMQQWIDKGTGKQRSRIDVLAENIQFLGGGYQGQGGQNQSGGRY